jgi:hypothetical protein
VVAPPSLDFFRANPFGMMIGITQGLSSIYMSWFPVHSIQELLGSWSGPAGNKRLFVEEVDAVVSILNADNLVAVLLKGGSIVDHSNIFLDLNP